VNEGFKMANGEVVIWLNGDDILFDKNTISTIVRIFEREPSVSILYGNRADLDKHTRLKNILVPVPWFSHKRLRRWYFAPFVFMRKEVVEKHKLDPDYEYVLDYEYYVRVSGDGFSFKYVPKTLYGFRKHKKAKSSAGSTQMNAEAQKLKKEIGLNSGLNHSVQRIVDKLLYIVLQVWGVILYIYHKKLGQNFCK
jgi:GT2 family glycosyltransferase